MAGDCFEREERQALRGAAQPLEEHQPKRGATLLHRVDLDRADTLVRKVWRRPRRPQGSAKAGQRGDVLDAQVGQRVDALDPQRRA